MRFNLGDFCFGVIMLLLFSALVSVAYLDFQQDKRRDAKSATIRGSCTLTESGFDPGGWGSYPQDRYECPDGSIVWLRSRR